MVLSESGLSRDQLRTLGKIVGGFLFITGIVATLAWIAGADGLFPLSALVAVIGAIIYPQEGGFTVHSKSND
ncbi:hypothetical protein [Halococcus sp. IIIV-5B]|uniref:hypothetical protein n=1 Tax=Halococcus sp. IIIV-5B TaxID=2321230 RepID=UPI0011C3A777|nr:hypothetical protein [Halococcus sp. IIIV-5B]